jgi:hypothetical protein
MAGTSGDNVDVQENVVVEEPQEEKRNGIDFLKDDSKDMTLGRRIGAQLTSFSSITYIHEYSNRLFVFGWLHFISLHHYSIEFHEQRMVQSSGGYCGWS